jgi:hypothetical protein
MSPIATVIAESLSNMFVIRLGSLNADKVVIMAANFAERVAKLRKILRPF